MFCKKCGNEMNNNVKFCNKCGTMVDGAMVAPITNGQPTMNQGTTEEKFWGVLAYFSWLVLIPIFAAPRSKFVRYHMNQGLVLAITESIWWGITAGLNLIFYSISISLGSVVTILLRVVNVALFALRILGIVNAANGKAKELPVIGSIQILK